jgi:radical SAM protein with 4Fe4S-binding SPASM domain
MMCINYHKMAALAQVAATAGANLRVNVYQPSKTDQFTLTYTQFWDGFKRLANATRLVATTEPVLAGVLGLPEFVGPACGRSTVRVAPDGRVLPCTYWPQSALTLMDLQTLGENITHTSEFRAASSASALCDGCPCRGGCAGRRAVLGDLAGVDPYCPFARHDHIVLDWEQVPHEDLPKVGSACTTVVSAM